jgi:hypothetical protein
MLKAKDAVERRLIREFVRRRSINHMADAWREGAEARQQGAAREDLPDDYRERARAAEGLAWLLGYDGEPLG